MSFDSTYSMRLSYWRGTTNRDQGGLSVAGMTPVMASLRATWLMIMVRCCESIRLHLKQHNATTSWLLAGYRTTEGQYRWVIAAYVVWRVEKSWQNTLEALPDPQSYTSMCIPPL
jgi:hypothetical protein